MVAFPEAMRYVVVGGMAMIQAGFVRATEDIDLLVDVDRDNLNRLRAALLERRRMLMQVWSDYPGYLPVCRDDRQPSGYDIAPKQRDVAPGSNAG